jgi:hypothetical protein
MSLETDLVLLTVVEIYFFFGACCAEVELGLTTVHIYYVSR